MSLVELDAIELEQMRLPLSGIVNLNFLNGIGTALVKDGKVHGD